MKRLLNSYLCLCCAWLAGGFGAPAAAADNVFFSGQLMDQTCTLEPGSETRTLDFEDVSQQELYREGRTASKAVVLNLLDCDSNAGRTEVKVTLGGHESQQIQGFLELDSGSPQGLVIGLEDAAAQPLPLGRAHSIGRISQDGKQSVTFLAYLKALPNALREHSIGKGPLAASLTFTLSYE
ncbi:exotoxin [Pseudomonas protegens]|uniref:Exotoxin n=1 Tax=Pseudomonas protegens TaxID=380021 RepID=A0A9Q6ICS8_9PSED|nr:MULTISPECIES: fimbrial protein [Pseudomonas]MBW8354932.1 type 1 fimbrial protein [Pseudomonas sp.]PYC03706.1 exotoxin [Pseudomonas protegens]PYC32333.1 exotoxin [Pseudomonas protegens]